MALANGTENTVSWEKNVRWVSIDHRVARANEAQVSLADIRGHPGPLVPTQLAACSLWPPEHLSRKDRRGQSRFEQPEVPFKESHYWEA